MPANYIPLFLWASNAFASMQVRNKYFYYERVYYSRHKKKYIQQSDILKEQRRIDEGLRIVA